MADFTCMNVMLYFLMVNSTKFARTCGKSETVNPIHLVARYETKTSEASVVGWDFVGFFPERNVLGSKASGKCRSIILTQPKQTNLNQLVGITNNLIFNIGHIKSWNFGFMVRKIPWPSENTFRRFFLEHVYFLGVSSWRYLVKKSFTMKVQGGLNFTYWSDLESHELFWSNGFFSVYINFA